MSTHRDELIGLPEAARLLGIHYRTMRRWVAAGNLPATRVGPKLLKVRRSDLDRLMQPAGGAA
jgi:excisionase family DNA binding protein